MMFSALAIDEMTTAELHRTALQTGDAEVEFILARRCFSGYKAEANEEEALFWFTQAADQGHIGAICSLYEIFRDYFLKMFEKNHWDAFLSRSKSPEAVKILEEYYPDNVA